MADLNPAPEAPAAPEPTTAAPEALVAPPAAPQPEAPKGEDIDFNSLSLEQIERIVAAGNNPEATNQPTETPTTAAPVNPEAAPNAEPPATPPEEDEVPQTLPKNFRFHTEDPQFQRLLLGMRQNPGANPIDIAKMVGYEMPANSAAPVAPVTPATPPAPPEEPGEIKAIRSKIDELIAKRKDARTAFQDHEVDELTDQIGEAKTELKEAERSHREQVQAAAEWEGDMRASLDEVYSQYPEAKRAGSPQQRALIKELALARHENDPVMQRPDYIRELLKRAADSNSSLFPGVKAGATPAPVVPVKVNIPPPVRSPNGSVESPNPGGPPIQPATPQAIQQDLSKLNPDQLAELAVLVDKQSAGR